MVQRKQVALLSARSVAYRAEAAARLRLAMPRPICALVAVFIIGMLGVCQYAALVKFWPYDLSLA